MELWAEARKVPHFSEWLRNWQRKVLFSSSTSSSFLHQLFFRQSRKYEIAPVELWAEARKVPHFSDWLRSWQRKSAFLFFNFIFFSSSTFLSSSFLHQLFFRQSRKEKLQKKAALSRKEIVRCFRVMEIIGSGGCGAGTRRFVGAFLLLSVGLRFWFTFFTFEGYRAQTPCDLYSLLLVISYHPPASHCGRSVF